MALHVGTYDEITLQSRERWTPRGGIVREPRVKLLNTSVAAYVATLRTAGYSYEVEPIGETPHSIVTMLSVEEGATSTTVLNDTWELDGNDLEKSIWEHPDVVALFGQGSDAKAKADFRALVEQFARGEYTGTQSAFMAAAGAALLGGAGTGLSTEDQATVESLISSITSGVEAFSVSTYVLRRTLTLTAGTEIAPGFANANKIFTSAQLQAAETTIPDNLGDTLPAGVWLKKTPSAVQQPDGRWVYRVEYWWAESYDEFLYEAAS